MRQSPIIEIDELLKIYHQEDVMIFDVRNGNNAKKNYEAEHLSGALFIDVNTQLADIQDDLANGGRHPLPSIETFAKTLTETGITKNKRIILYDDKNGANAAARFWWMLRAAGHAKVQVLNGGLQQAKKNNFPMSSKKEVFLKAAENFIIKEWKLPLVTIEEVEDNVLNQEYIILDVREKDRYDGKIEPIDLIAGHIPGAVNIPFTENTNSDGLLISPDELKDKYEAAFGQIASKNIVVHCGSGVTACYTLLALDYADMDIPNLYVGSWSEWSRNQKKIETSSSVFQKKMLH